MSTIEYIKKKATVKRRGFGAYGEHESYYELDPVLFAELIIKECIESCEQELLGSSDDWNKAINSAITNIKSKFRI